MLSSSSFAGSSKNYITTECVAIPQGVDSSDGSPAPKRLRIVGSTTNGASKAADANVDPVLSELINTLQISHNTSCSDFKQLTPEELLKRVRETISLLQPGKPLETSLAAGNVLLNLAVAQSIPNKCLFSLFDLVTKPETHISILNLILRVLWYMSKTNPSLKSRLTSSCFKVLAINPHRTAQMTAVEILGDVGDVETDSNEVLKTFDNLSYSQDSRVRCVALQMVYQFLQRGGQVSLAIYYRCLALFEDDNEHVRIEAIKIVCNFAKINPNTKVPMDNRGDDVIRLEEHAFSRICDLVNDIQVNVKVTALTVLRQFCGVDQSFLEQTLDKQLMSHLRTKRNFHQRKSELVRSGAFSSGRKWGDDAPLENVDEQSVSLISSGACGALIHGLEDEFKEVRSAAVETLSVLARDRAKYAEQSLDFFIDMLNDEIEAVRVKALESLAIISHHVITRKDQMVDILSCLDDYSGIVREKVHNLLRVVQFEEMDCLKLSLQKLMRNLMKYPLDKLSIFAALKHLGLRHSSFVFPYMKELLCAHSFLDTAEPKVDDPFYIAILILILNASSISYNLVEMFPPFISRHHQYLKELHPEYIPELDLNKNSLKFCYKQSERFANVPDVDSLAKSQYSSVIDKLQKSKKLNIDLMRNLIRDLTVLKDCEVTRGDATFLSLSLRVNSSLLKVYEKLQNISPTSEVGLSDEYVFSELTKSIQINFALEGIFTNYSQETVLKVLENRCVLSTLLFFFTLLKESGKTSIEKAKTCQLFVQNLRLYDVRVQNYGSSLPNFAQNLMNQLSIIDPSKISLILKFIHPSLLGALSSNLNSHLVLPYPGSSSLGNDESSTSIGSGSISMASAVINYPHNSERVESFMAGLILALRLDVTLKNINDIDRIRIVLTYPGGTDQVVSPSQDKFSRCEPETSDSGQSSGKTLCTDCVKICNDYKLSTTCFISHASWTDPGDLSIGVYLAVPKLFDENLSVDSPEKLVSISSKVKIVIHPKPNAL